MTFHIANDHAAYFGLDGGTNDLAFGGWSKGANSYKVWHAGNDGSGSTLDADLLDGNHASAFLTSVPDLAASKITSGTFSSARMPASFGADSVTQDDITNRTESGFYQTSTATTAEGWPFGGSWCHLLATTHTNDNNYYSMQIAGSFFDQSFYGRKTNNSGTQSWVRFITTADEGSGNGFDADTLDGVEGSSYWTKSGSWVGDLGSNGFTRLQGVTSGGGEFVLATKNGQISTLIDGSYFAYEAGTNQGGGFYSSTSSNYANAPGIIAANATTLKVCQADGGNASLQITGDLVVNSDGSTYALDVTGHAFVKGPDGWNGTGDKAIVALGSAVSNEKFGCGYVYGTGLVLSTYKPSGSGHFGSSTQNSLIIADTTGEARFINDVVAYASSDKRLKENVKPLDNALDKINKINGVEFDWIEGKDEHGNSVHSNEGHDVGVIAQEIEEVLPEVVHTRDNGYKAVKYEKIVPLLIEAIKEQQQQINELKEKLNG